MAAEINTSIVLGNITLSASTSVGMVDGLKTSVQITDVYWASDVLGSIRITTASPNARVYLFARVSGSPSNISLIARPLIPRSDIDRLALPDWDVATNQYPVIDSTAKMPYTVSVSGGIIQATAISGWVSKSAPDLIIS